MKKLIVVAALMLSALTTMLYAQEPTMYDIQAARTKADKTFNVWDNQTLIRDIVQLRQGKMVLSMLYVKDFESFTNLDSILVNLRKDIAFYKDSLDAAGAGHVRIDYVISPEYSFKKIRFKKYPTDGDIFIDRSGEVSHLKLDQDTVNIIFEKLLYKSRCTVPYDIKATFIVDNYTDIDKIAADKMELHRIIDTLARESQNKSDKQGKPSHFPCMSIIYNPYFGSNGSFKKYYGRIVDDKVKDGTQHNKWNKGQTLTLAGALGGALTLNSLTPYCEAGLTFTSYKGNVYRQTNFFKLYASSYYFFDRDLNNNLLVRDNWFVNASIGSAWEKSVPGWVGNVADFGVGYLFAQKGGYFKNLTMKAFTDIHISHAITISPELMGTNNFRQIFPGITVKVVELK